MALQELDRLQMHYIEDNIFELKKSVRTNYELGIVSYIFYMIDRKSTHLNNF